MAQPPPPPRTPPYQPPIPYPPPGGVPPYGYPPPPKKDDTVLIVVVIVVVLVMIIAVALVVFFVLLAGPLTNAPPSVTFGPVSKSGGNATVEIATVSRAVAFAFFKANLGYEGVTGLPQSLLLQPAYETISISGHTFRVYFQDANANLAVDSGDAIRITGDNAALPAGNYTIYLMWALTSNAIGQRSFVV